MAFWKYPELNGISVSPEGKIYENGILRKRQTGVIVWHEGSEFTCEMVLAKWRDETQEPEYKFVENPTFQEATSYAPLKNLPQKETPITRKFSATMRNRVTKFVNSPTKIENLEPLPEKYHVEIPAEALKLIIESQKVHDHQPAKVDDHKPKCAITNLKTVKNYAESKSISKSAVFKQIENHKLKATEIDGVIFIDTMPV